MKSQYLFFAKTNPDAIIPTKRREDSGYDMYGCFEESQIILKPGDIKLIPTGIATGFPNDFVLFVKERSSSGSIGLSTRMGVVDSGYRGEIKIALNNTSNKIIVIEKRISQIIYEDDLIKYPYSKAIAQAVLCNIPTLEVNEISYEKLLNMTSKRGVSFLGASGK